MAPALHQQQQQQPLQQQPSPAPRSSSYMLMLNSFASDLDSILNDLSTSPPPPETPTADASAAPIAAGDAASGGESSSHSSCPDLPSLTSTDETDAAPVHPHSDESPPPEDISLLERLIRSHPIWYLPKIQRVAAAQLLQHQEQGVFIVRQSSQPGTLALSVKLTAQSPPPVNASAPIGVGVQHYLIEAADQSSPSSGVRLESSDFIFDNLPALLAHYCQCCDELPVQLRLPGRIRTASTRQSLTAAALLGQEFWNDDNSQQTIIVTIPSKRNPPVPPLRLSTFDPFGSLDNNSAPPATVQRSNSIVEQPLSPRLEARGTEPVPPPPPPRWCKPPVRPSAVNSAASTSSRTSPVAVPSASPNPEDAMEHDPSPKSADGKASPPRTSESPGVDSGAESKPKIGRRGRARRVARPRRRRRKSSDDDFNDDDADDDDECHHSSLADKASDYEDIWGTSPNQDESSSPPIVDAMEDVGRGDSSSNSTLEKLTSTLDTCQPDDEAETQKADTSSAVSAKENDRIVENKENVPTEDAETLPVVRRRPPSSNSNNSNGSSKESKDSGAQTKRTSPLYSEPADALPPSLGAHPPLPIGPCWLKNKTRPLPLPPPFPSSGNGADFSTFARDGYVKCLAASSTSAAAGVAVAGGALWLSNPQTSAQPPKAKGKVVQMPKPPTGLPPIAGSGSSRKKSAFPSVIYLPPTGEPSTSLQDVVITLCPAAALPSPPPASGCTSQQRVSAYDNLSGSAGDLEPEDEDESDDDDADEMSDDGTVTEFSEPWDSTRWDRLLSSPSGSRRSGRRINSLSSTAGHTETPTSSEETTGGAGSAGSDGSRPPTPPTHSADHQRQMKPPIPPHHQSCSVQASMKLHLQRTRSFKDKMDPLLASPRLLALRSTCNSQAGKKLQAFVLQLGRDTSTTFGRSLQHFLQCTREAKEQRAVPVLRNVRQFISGIKNFLVQHGEASFDSALLEIRSKLKSNEFLNVDVVLEMVLHQLVTLPLRSHLYKLLSQESLASGMVQQLVTGIRIGREMHPSSLGLKEGQLPPSGDTLQRASTSLERLQQAASPLDKLEHLLDACAAIYNHAARTCGETVAAEDFLPLLAWLLARCGFISAEIEADFMWALLQPSLLAGEGGYFLTALSSAAQLLKNLPSQLAAPPGSSVSALNTSAQSNRSASPTDSTSWMGTLSSIPEWSTAGGAAYPQPCVLRVLVADENQSSLLARTVPLRPAMTVRDVTKLLALKLRLSNPQEFTLVALVDGQEIQLSETESPQTILGNAFGGRPCVTFAFRRQDAKIAWPRQMMDV